MFRRFFISLSTLSGSSKKTMIIGADFLYYLGAVLITVFLTDNIYSVETCKYALVFSLLSILIALCYRTYRVVWGFFGLHDVKQILKSTLTSIFVFGLVTGGTYDIQFLAILFLISGQLLCLARVLYANWRTIFLNMKSQENVLIIGAGEAGEQLCRELKRSTLSRLNPIGFLDDYPSRLKVKIHGVSVLGTIGDLLKIRRRFGVSKAIIAIPSASAEQINRIYELAQASQVELSTLPPLTQILDGKVFPHQVRDVAPEDLLGRARVQLDEALIGQLLNSKVVLVTGAGGSIGSELCLQVAAFKPKTLILFEQSEFALYQIDMQLREQFPGLDIVPIMGDVRSNQRVETVLAKYLPNSVFHAAAYKHVPMVEHNPGEAVHTNIGGTENIARQSGKYDVDKFVLVSTDKAVNPTNVMGATKRVAEVICQLYSKIFPSTSYMIVRFGNVLGSNGSVIPRFKSQIERGGPVTVTHKDITRFFMSIPEASQLVIYATAVGKSGEIYVLDMGEPVKILDLAIKMIRLSGFTPNKEIEIKVTGLRPGEKLFEELLADDEHSVETKHEKLRIARNREVDPMVLNQVNELLKLGRSEDLDTVVAALRKLVPEFDHKR